MSDEIVCIGEILWDALPDGLFLGGAPFNAASHLHALGEDVVFVSRVGDGRLGEEARRRLRARKLDASLQTDEALPTGFVRVALDADSGEPDYEILKPTAWDAIAWTDALERRAEEAEALVYGSLAQRANPSRKTIRRLWEADALRAFDVNLRPPYDDRAVVEPSLQAADVVKLNEAELQRMRDWFGLPATSDAAMGDLATAFGCTAVCVTEGAEGARLWQDGDCSHHPGYSVEGEDPVGAGDAFLAVLLAGLLDGRGGSEVLALANRLGAYVAAHAGALPAYEIDTLDEVRRLPLDG